jgi:hypothetical protein
MIDMLTQIIDLIVDCIFDKCRMNFMRCLMVDTLPPLVVQLYLTETDLRRVVSWRVTQVHGLVSSGCLSLRDRECTHKMMWTRRPWRRGNAEDDEIIGW